MGKPYILAIGDSLTAGYGLPLDDSFPMQLQAILRNRHPAAIVQNAGVSGDTSASARQRLPRLLTSLKALPDLAIVELGANDFLRAVSPRQTYQNLDTILDEIGRCGIPILIAAMEVPAFLGRFAQDCAAIYSDLAEKHQTAICTFYPAGVLGNRGIVIAGPTSSERSRDFDDRKTHDTRGDRRPERGRMDRYYACPGTIRMTPLSVVAIPVRRALVSMVRNVFNDRNKGEKPVVRSTNALFKPDSVIWRVHGDVTTMMVGGVSALLMQMLHPAALAGVWEHSSFRDDMLGRLRRTARFIALTTYGDRNDAEAAIATVVKVHTFVNGTMPDGQTYSAADPQLLAWIHVTEAVCFLDAWIRYAEPDMSARDQDRYFKEFAMIARALDADPVPESRAEADALIASFRPSLLANARTREVGRMVLQPPSPQAAFKPAQDVVMQAAVDLLPGWARKMHWLRSKTLQKPLVRGFTSALASTLRWAFSEPAR